MRTLELHAHRNGIIPVLRSDESLRRVGIFNPVLEVVDNVMRSGGRSGVLSEHPSSSARDSSYTAVCHARDAEVAVEIVHGDVVDSEFGGDFEVVALGIAAGDERVGGAVVHEEFASCGAETAEVAGELGHIAVVGVESVGASVVGLVHVERVPGWVVVDCVAVPVAGDGLDTAGELAEAEGIDLGAVEECWVEEFAFGVVEFGEDFSDCVDLGVGQAAGEGSVVAASKNGRVELAESWVFEDAIVDAVKLLIALIEDGGLDCNPVILSKEFGVGVGCASELHETAAPGL